MAETLDLFSQVNNTTTVPRYLFCFPPLMRRIFQFIDENGGRESDEEAEDEQDIEAQIRKEVEGLKPGGEKRPRFRAIRLDVPCCSFHPRFNSNCSLRRFCMLNMQSSDIRTVR